MTISMDSLKLWHDKKIFSSQNQFLYFIRILKGMTTHTRNFPFTSVVAFEISQAKFSYSLKSSNDDSKQLQIAYL